MNEFVIITWSRAEICCLFTAWSMTAPFGLIFTRLIINNPIQKRNKSENNLLVGWELASNYSLSVTRIYEKYIEIVWEYKHRLYGGHGLDLICTRVSKATYLSAAQQPANTLAFYIDVVCVRHARALRRTFHFVNSGHEPGHDRFSHVALRMGKQKIEIKNLNICFFPFLK